MKASTHAPLTAPVAPRLPLTTRDKILHAAAHNLQQLGIEPLTFVKIAQEVGISHAAIYRHFADKDAIFDALLNQKLRLFEMRLQDVVQGPDPADDKLERFLATLTRYYGDLLRKDGMLFQLLARPCYAKKETIRHQQRIRNFLEKIVEEGRHSRLFLMSDQNRMVDLVCDLTYRFSDPLTLLNNTPLQEGEDLRRDRVIRWAIRSLTAR